jgi:ketosteroid isomerase-like protein
MDERCRELVKGLFDAFNRRDAAGIVALCHEDMEFFAATAEEIGRSEPYVGHDGLNAYLDDVSTAWEELLISPGEVEQRGEELLVRGRVYLRSRELGIRDMPVAWIWELRGDRFARGRAFADPEQAIQTFSREATPQPRRDQGASRSMTPLP